MSEFMPLLQFIIIVIVTDINTDIIYFFSHYWTRPPSAIEISVSEIRWKCKL